MHSKAFEHGVKLAYTNQHAMQQLRIQQMQQQHARSPHMPQPARINADWHTPERATLAGGLGAAIGGTLGVGHGLGRGYGGFRGGVGGALLGAGLAGGGYALANIAGR